MKSLMRKNAVYAFLIFCTPGINATAFGQPAPDGDKILQQLEELWSGVQDYTVTLDVTADIERMNVPPMHVKMYYKQPDKTHFESEGFAILPREALRLNAQGLRKRFSVEQALRDTFAGKSVYRLRLISKGETGAARRLNILVDPANSTLLCIEGGTSDNRRMRAVFEYMRVKDILVPSKLHVEFVAEAPPVDMGPMDQNRPSGRKGIITIEFRDYVLNSGLSDDVFTKEPKQP